MFTPYPLFLNLDQNLQKAFTSSNPCLRLLIQRKGESWEEKYGYGTNTFDRKRKGFSILVPNISKSNRRIESIGGISNPLEDFRHVFFFKKQQYINQFQVSAIVDVHVVPSTHRRVRLCKYGSEKPLGFYIKTGIDINVGTLNSFKIIFKESPIVCLHRDY